MCNALFVRFSNNGDEPSDGKSSCPCFYSQIEGLWFHVVYMIRYAIRIKKHLRNGIKIVEIERQYSKSNWITRNTNCYTPAHDLNLVPGVFLLRVPAGGEREPYHLDR